MSSILKHSELSDVNSLIPDLTTLLGYVYFSPFLIVRYPRLFGFIDSKILMLSFPSVFIFPCRFISFFHIFSLLVKCGKGMKIKIYVQIAMFKHKSLFYFNSTFIIGY